MASRSDLTATHERYATLAVALDILSRRIAEAKVIHAEKGNCDDEGQALDAVIEAALITTILAAELDAGATEASGFLFARVVVAAKVAEVAAEAIHTPMDAPLARVRCASDLLDQALEAFAVGERRGRP